MKPFLTAEWRNLILLTYTVEPEILEPYLPPGIELDMIDNRAFVSFVAFDFLNTRVRGLSIPFHRHFPEINLRFYVKYGGQRGVMFVKELVPRFCIAGVARRVYNEPYEAIKMHSEISSINQKIVIEHEFEYGEKEHQLRFIVDNEPYLPDENSSAHFFKEHEWGFGTNRQGKLLAYQVEHPHWRVYPLRTRFHLEIDFELIYGERWRFLNGKIPYNILVVEGSPVKVFPGKIIS